MNPPYILAIETATMLGSVALFEGDELLGLLEYRRAKSHARLLAPMISTLLKDLEVERSQLSAIAVAKGPGSYTGLRVGVSTAKGLCMALDKPLLSINSLEGLAWKVQSLAKRLDAFICPMIDARRMEVYCQVFNADIQPLHEPMAKIVEEGAFGEILAQKKVIFLGDGAAKCEEILTQSPNAIVLPSGLSSAADMGKALHQKFQAEEFEDLMTFEPFYLKDFRVTKPKNRLL